jgi:predicted dehydrogenase
MPLENSRLNSVLSSGFHLNNLKQIKMKTVKNILLIFLLILITMPMVKAQSTATKPIRLAIAGMTHGHIVFILGRKKQGDFLLTGVYEPNKELALSLAKKYDLNPDLIYSNLDTMLDKVKPEAVVAFGSTYQHMAVVTACAPRGINVMVEKPLATTVKDAERMATLARKYHIQLLTDYETSWYPTTAKSFQLVNDSSFVGKLKKVVMNDGHQGPKEIGCDKVFLDWLTDPVQNGAGALFDFGCYGANLMTDLMHNEEPLSVTAVTKQYKPDIYPKVDDDATIIVNYPKAECIIQASWNWPFNRKDMEIYGDSGYIITIDNDHMRLRNRMMPAEKSEIVTDKDVNVYEDPFSYFYDVIKGNIKMKPYGLYALDNNVLVVKILAAARKSAKTGKTVRLK